MFKRIISIGLGVIAGYLIALGAMQVAQAWGLWPDREVSAAAARVREVMLLVNKHYAEPAPAKADEIAGRAIEGVLQGLDRYSEYLDARGYERLHEDVDGAFGGIGVQVEQVEERLVVVAPIAGTPGERAGILRGDVIARIDGESIKGVGLDAAIGRLRGKPGTVVNVGVDRGEPARELEFSIKREVIKVESVRDAAMLEPGVGYVRVTMFGERTGEEFAAALAGLRASDGGLRALVLDLRNNPGGLLDAAVDLVEPFFKKGELVVYTEGRDRAGRVELRAKGRFGEPLDVPVAVLVNGGSASAAEIVSGALKDTGRAVLVGEKTFGKGSVQTIFPLRDGAALRLTTARYYTPSGVVIHEKGIEPDVVEALTPEQEKAVFLARLRPDVSDPAEFEKRFGVAPVADTQLAAALAGLRRRLAGEPFAPPAVTESAPATAAAGSAAPVVEEAAP